MPSQARGSCICGAVTFRIEGPFRGFQYCHCSRCRKKTASLRQLRQPLRACRAVHLGPGRGQHQALRASGRPSGGAPAFCTECGSAVPWLTKQRENHGRRRRRASTTILVTRPAIQRLLRLSRAVVRARLGPGNARDAPGALGYPRRGMWMNGCDMRRLSLRIAGVGGRVRLVGRAPTPIDPVVTEYCAMCSELAELRTGGQRCRFMAICTDENARLLRAASPQNACDETACAIAEWDARGPSAWDSSSERHSPSTTRILTFACPRPTSGTGARAPRARAIPYPENSIPSFEARGNGTRAPTASSSMQRSPMDGRVDRHARRHSRSHDRLHRLRERHERSSKIRDVPPARRRWKPDDVSTAYPAKKSTDALGADALDQRGAQGVWRGVPSPTTPTGVEALVASCAR